LKAIAFAFISLAKQCKVFTFLTFVPTMIAKRTNEMMSVYEEDKEAIFFSNENELISKLKFYLNNRDLLKSIGVQGYKRAYKS